MNAHTPFDANQDWTNPYCQNSSNDPMVDALLGNAYHVVRTVYCNLGNLKLIYDFLNQYGMVLGVQSEAELKALTTKATFARIYDKTPAGDRRVTDYLYVEGDRTGILPDNIAATGSWVKVATSGSSGGGESSSDGGYIPWIYNSGSANGGETTIRIPDETAGAPFMIVNGDWQTEGYDFEYDPVAFEINFATPLEPGDFVVVMRTGVPATPDNPNVSDWVTINWLYNQGAAVGGEQVIDIPYTFQSVPAVYKNGLRFCKGLTNNSYTIDSDNNRIILTEPLATNDRLIIQLGGEANVLEVADHTIQEVARSANVKDSEVILSTDTTQVLNGKKIVYSVSEQKSYGLPVLPTNVYIQSVANGKLTYNPGSVIVDLLSVPSEALEAVNLIKTNLLSESGASLVGYTKPYTGAVKRLASDYFNQEINVDDFGAYGDAYLLNGTVNPNRHDDTAAFQAALVAAWRAGGVKVVATPWKSYYIAGKVYVLASESPSDIEATNFPKRRMQVIDFQGARIVGRDDTSDTTNVFMETGYITSTGSIASVFGKSWEEYLTIGTTIRNATLVNFYQGFRLRDHVFGCEVTDIVGVNVQQLIYTQRCFYSLFRNLQCNGTYTTGLHRYHFTDECNIQPLVSVHTGQCDVGIKFEGAVEALTLFNCGIESFRTHGVWIAGAYNIKFDSCYFESNHPNVYGCIATSANNITLDNNWIYGSSFKMFGGFDDNTNVRMHPNNRIGGGAVWWDLNEGSPYNLSDLHFPTDIKAGGNTLPVVSAKEASTVNQTITFYDPNLGLSSIVGKAEQTNRFHPQRVNGQMSIGSTASYTVGASTTTEVVGNDTRVKWTTQIRYSDTQLLYVALKVDNNLGTWFWLGHVVGGTAKALLTSDESKPPVVTNENGYVTITSPLLATPIAIHGGEIRIL